MTLRPYTMQAGGGGVLHGHVEETGALDAEAPLHFQSLSINRGLGFRV